MTDHRSITTAPRTSPKRSVVVMRRFLSAFAALAKYQVVTKIIQFGMLFPIFWTITHKLLDSAGFVALTNFSAPAFLLTWQGGVWILLTVVMIFLTLLMEIGGFMIISAVKIHHLPDPSYWSVLRATMRAIPSFIGPGAVVVTFMVMVVLPLVGSEMSLSFMAGFRIPNFVTSVIYENPVYLGIYGALMAAFYLLTVCASFMFHFMLLACFKPYYALRASVRLLKRHFWAFVGFIVLNVVMVLLMLAGVAVFGLGVYYMIGESLTVPALWAETLVLSSTFIVLVLLAALAYLATPFFIFLLTDRYYAYLEADRDHDSVHLSTQRGLAMLSEAHATSGASSSAGDVRRMYEASRGNLVSAAELVDRLPEVSAKTTPSILDRLVRLTPLVVLIGVGSIVFAAHTLARDAESFVFDHEIPVIAHRAGPADQYVENTMPAIEAAIGQGAEYIEVDVQRTVDGHYILYHDDTFQRLAQDPRQVTGVTLKDALSLDLARGASNDPQEPVRVVTVEDLFNVCQGRIGIFLELKGKNADKRMVDDMVALVEKHKMVDSVVVMSLSYDLIEYVEDRYPHIQSGFTYFLSLGDDTGLVGDYVIVEEDALTVQRLYEFHAAGKKVAVWTLNEPDSMAEFVHWPIDGAITDYVGRWNRAVQERNSLPKLEQLYYFFTH